MKPKYQEPHMEVVGFEHKDVIATSGEKGVQWSQEWTDVLER